METISETSFHEPVTTGVPTVRDVGQLMGQLSIKLLLKEAASAHEDEDEDADESGNGREKVVFLFIRWALMVL